MTTSAPSWRLGRHRISSWTFFGSGSTHGLWGVARIAQAQKAPSTIIAVPLLVLTSLGSVLVRRNRDWMVLLTVGVISVAFFLNIVLFLPLVDAFGAGYWLPRLIAPALLCFFVLLFVGLDRLLGKRRYLSWACLALVTAQAVVHLSFLWPTPPAGS